MGIFSGSLDCPLYTGLTVLYIQAWLSFICRFYCPLHTGLTVLYIQVWLSFIYRFDCPLFTGLTFRYIQVWLSFIYKKKKKLNINIASIFITLTEINNETHYVAKKIKNKKPNKKKPKTTIKKTNQNCSDRIRTLSVNQQGSRSSDYTITASVQWSNL